MLIGFALKPFFIPFGSYIIIVTITLLMLYYAFSIVYHFKSMAHNVVGVATALVLFALFCTLKLYPFRHYTLGAAAVGCLVALFFLLKERIFIVPNVAALLIGIFFLVSFRVMNKSDRYYLWNVKYNYRIEQDYKTWDRYSWALYLDSNYAEAISANQQAMKILEENNDTVFLEIVKKHHEEISKNLKH